MKVFAGSAEFKSLKREIDVVRSLPSHENIVMLFGDEEEVSCPCIILLWFHSPIVYNGDMVSLLCE